jgi:hypothetical protein
MQINPSLIKIQAQEFKQGDPAWFSLKHFLAFKRCPLRAWKLLELKKYPAPSLDSPKVGEASTVSDSLKSFRRIIAQRQFSLVQTAFLEWFSVQRAATPIRPGSKLNLKNKGLYLASEVQFDRTSIVLDAVEVNEDESLKVYLIKSSSGVKERYVEEAAYLYYFLSQSGYRISDILLCIVKRKAYGSPQDYINLLSINEELSLVQPNVDEDIVSATAVLIEMRQGIWGKLEAEPNEATAIGLETPPTVSIGMQCNKPFVCRFKSDCWRSVPEYSVFNIPHLAPEKKQALLGDGIIALEDISDLSAFKPRQQKFIHSVLEKNNEVNWSEIARQVKALHWPLSFLDFEADNPAVPMYEGSPSFEKVVFQFSCHSLSEEGEVTHTQYLFDEPGDPREAVVSALCEAVPAQGTIVVWHADFERSRLRDMALRFPAYAPQLQGMIDRVWDLELIFKSHFIDYRMKGSSSLKYAYPVIIEHCHRLLQHHLPRLRQCLIFGRQADQWIDEISRSTDHSELVLNDGEQIMAAWYLLLTTNDPVFRRELYERMLKYCALDTRSLLDIVVYLHIELALLN